MAEYGLINYTTADINRLLGKIDNLTIENSIANSFNPIASKAVLDLMDDLLSLINQEKSFGTLSNVGNWADLAAPEDRVLIQLKGSILWTSKNLSEIVSNNNNFSELFEKVNIGTEEKPTWAIKAKYGLFTDQFLSSKGLSTGESGGGGGGLDENLLWNILGDGENPNKQINISHLTDALSTYATIVYVDGIKDTINADISSLSQRITDHINNTEIHVTKEFKDIVDKLYSWFAEDENGNIYTKDYTSADGVLMHRGFYSNSFVSAKGLAEGNIGGGGLDETLLWQILGNTGNEQISKTHLTDALTGYATQQWVLNKNYITNEALTGYATEEWVNNKNYATNDNLNIHVNNNDIHVTLEEKTLWNKIANYFAEDIENNAIYVKDNKGFYSNSFISTKGMSSGGSSGGGLDETLLWQILGNNGTEQISKTHLITALSEYITIASADGKYATKTELSNYATIESLNQTNANVTAVTNKLNDFLEGSDTDTIINKWKELEAFLSGMSESDNLAEILATKADITWTQEQLDLKLDKSIFNDLFEKVQLSDGNYAIRAKYGFYSDNFVSSKGLSYEIGGGITGNITINIGNESYESINGVVTLPPYPEVTELSWNNIIDKPTWIGDTKPSYSFSEITNTPITLSGYGIKDGVNDVSFTGNGNAITSASISGHILILTKGSTFLLSSAYTAEDILEKLKTVDGSSSGLDADTLDGTHKSGLLTAFSSSSSTNISITIGGITRSIPDLYAHSTYKLENKRTIWGQSFDGTDNIDGNLNDVGNIVFSIGGSIRNSSNYIGFYTSSSGAKGIKAKSIYLGSDYSASLSYVLYVSGTSYITGATSIYGATTLGSTLSVSSTSNFTGRTTHKGGVRIQSYIASSTTISLSTHPTFKLTADSSYGLYGWITGSGDAHLQAGYENNSGFFNIILNELGGNIGMGTKSPSEKLHVIGNILATGAITAKSISDIRLKNIIPTKVDYQQKLLDLGDVVDFYYNDTAINRNTGAVDRERHIGLIYQNAVKLNLVNFCHQDDDGFGSINYIAPDYINLIAGACQLNILGLRTLAKRTESIEQRVARLEKENVELKQKLDAYEKSNPMVS